MSLLRLSDKVLQALPRLTVGSTAHQTNTRKSMKYLSAGDFPWIVSKNGRHTTLVTNSVSVEQILPFTTRCDRRCHRSLLTQSYTVLKSMFSADTDVPMFVRFGLRPPVRFNLAGWLPMCFVPPIKKGQDTWRKGVLAPKPSGARKRYPTKTAGLVSGSATFSSHSYHLIPTPNAMAETR